MTGQLRDENRPRVTDGGPRRSALRRLTAISAVVTVLLAVDALYMQVSGYHASTTNNFNFSDAATVFIAAGLLLLLTVVLLTLWRRAVRTAR